MADWGQPRPRHQYTYQPRPYPGQKGVLTYAGPLNMTAAAHGYGAAGYPGYGAYGYGGAYGGAYGIGVCGSTYGVRQAYYPQSSYSPYTPYSPYNTYGSYYPHNYYASGYAQQCHAGAAYSSYGRYANCFSPWQSSYYHRVAGAVAPYSYAYPTSTAYVATTTTAQPAVQYAYVQAAATPAKLPDAYHTVNYASRLATTAPTADDIALENRRVATERGAYRPRKIKPADAKADDMFWVRERSGEWHCRPYYQIEELCQPGRWQMDAEHGFLVFHRD